MPLSTEPSKRAFVLYYNLTGNNNNPTHLEYRSHNPWQIAKRYCEALPQRHSEMVSDVRSLDDSVFYVVVSAEMESIPLDRIASLILDELALTAAPLVAGDRFIAAVPNAGTLQEIVQHTP